MSELVPCPGCRRHISGAKCPFCGADAWSIAARRESPVGRMSRAAVFAGATLAVAACGGKAKSADAEEPQWERRGGPCTTPDETEIARLEKEKEAAQTEEEKEVIEERLRVARQPVCAPYGAPPARRRLV